MPTLYILLICFGIMLIVFLFARADNKKNHQTTGPAIEIGSLRYGHYFGALPRNWVSRSRHPIRKYWQVEYSLTNRGVKVVNYATVHLFAVDTVGNRCSSIEEVKFTGPLSPGQRKEVLESFYWGKSVGGVLISKVDVIFSDGSHQTIKYNTNGTAYVENDTVSQTLVHQTGNVPTIQNTGIYEINHRDFVGTFQLGSYKPNTNNETWVHGQPSSDNTWSIQFRGTFHKNKTAHKMEVTIVPCDENMTPLTERKILSNTTMKLEPNCRYRLWWSGLWKDLPVRNIVIEKVDCFYTDGTCEVFKK